MGKYKRLPENYFKLTNPVVISVVCVGLYLLLMAWLDPENISPTFFGRVANLATWLGLEYNNAVKQIFLSTVAIHVGEMIASVYYCQKLKLNSTVTLAWMVQTLFLGMFSLWYLIWPKREIKEVPKSKETD
uniref:Transmembrane protein 254 n=1 Tax=Scylla olivacea TaxID=85551 RepID=A0A0P4WLC3_SCYOL